MLYWEMQKVENENYLLTARVRKLEEENKKLKEDTEHTLKLNQKCIGELSLENRDLKEEVKRLSKQIATNWWYKPEYVDKLKEKNQIYSNALVQEKEKNWKLKEKYDDMFSKACEYKNRIKDLEEEIEKLKEAIETLRCIVCIQQYFDVEVA